MYLFFIHSVNVTEDGRRALLTLAQGDMRKALNILQSASMAYKEVTEDNVYTCVGHPLKNDISNIVEWLLNDDFSVAYKSILYHILWLIMGLYFTLIEGITCINIKDSRSIF